MEAQDGSGPDHLTHYAQLLDRPQSYHIFHALRIIEAEFADAPRFGESARPREDNFRLGQEAELAFPPTTISSIEGPVAGNPGRLTNRFFGLFGPHGPMPLHITEYVRERSRNHRDHAFLEFANMLTSRLMGLFYRAWSVSHPAPSFDRSMTGNRGRAEPDPFARKVAALAGYHGRAFDDRDAMPDVSKRHFAGHLSAGPKHGEGLVSMISSFTRAPVRLRQFVGQWLDLEPDDQWQLGARVGLGMGTSLGQSVWSHSAKFRLHLGPLGLADFQRLMPGAPALDRLEAIVRNYVGDTLDWDINLILRRDEVPKAMLGQTVALGHTSWIGNPTGDKDADDLYLVPKSLSQRRGALH